jgi:hypothetical protein
MSFGAPADLFMQNKPNFQKDQMNVSYLLTKRYENKPLASQMENKPKQTQFPPKNQHPHPKQTQSNPISKAAPTSKSIGRGFPRPACFFRIRREFHFRWLRNILSDKNI